MRAVPIATRLRKRLPNAYPNRLWGEPCRARQARLTLRQAQGHPEQSRGVTRRAPQESVRGVEPRTTPTRSSARIAVRSWSQHEAGNVQHWDWDLAFGIWDLLCASRHAGSLA